MHLIVQKPCSSIVLTAENIPSKTPWFETIAYMKTVELDGACSISIHTSYDRPH